MRIPGDISAAAFLIGAAVVLPGSELVVENVGGLNPSRLGFLDVLGGQMGALVEIVNVEDLDGEPYGTIVARSAQLGAATVEGGPLFPAFLTRFPF